LTLLADHDLYLRGAGTLLASREAVALAERMYAAVGFRDLGRFFEYVPA
jgi:hypothetical protein